MQYSPRELSLIPCTKESGYIRELDISKVLPRGYKNVSLTQYVCIAKINLFSRVENVSIFQLIAIISKMNCKQ